MNPLVKAIYIAVLKRKASLKLHRVKGNEYTIIVQDTLKSGYKTDSNPIYILGPTKSWELRR